MRLIDMRSLVLGLLGGSLFIGCTAAPEALALDDLEEAQRQGSMGVIVPHGEQHSTSAPTSESRIEPEPEPEPEPLLDPLPDPGRVRPHLAFVWAWGDWAGAESCNFGVDLRGVPAVSLDGRYVLHDRRNESWESDGGEGWEDYDEHEPLREGGLALFDRETNETTWLGPLLPEATDLPHHNSGHIHCRDLRPLVEAGIERINESIPATQWRPMVHVEELGVLMGTAESNAEQAEQTPLELFLLQERTLVLRRKGVEVLHREQLDGLTRCNMPLELTNALVDIETGYTLATVAERCVCFGSESDSHFAFTLPQAARERIVELAPLGRAALDSR